MRSSICYSLPFTPTWRKYKREELQELLQVAASDESSHLAGNVCYSFWITHSGLCVVGVQLTFVEFNQNLLSCKENCHGHFSIHLHKHLLWYVKKNSLSSGTSIIHNTDNNWENKWKSINYHKTTCTIEAKSPLGQRRT